MSSAAQTNNFATRGTDEAPGDGGILSDYPLLDAGLVTSGVIGAELNMHWSKSDKKRDRAEKRKRGKGGPPEVGKATENVILQDISPTYIQGEKRPTRDITNKSPLVLGSSEQSCDTPSTATEKAVADQRVSNPDTTDRSARTSAPVPDPRPVVAKLRFRPLAPSTSEAQLAKSGAGPLIRGADKLKSLDGATATFKGTQHEVMAETETSHEQYPTNSSTIAKPHTTQTALPRSRTDIVPLILEDTRTVTIQESVSVTAAEPTVGAETGQPAGSKRGEGAILESSYSSRFKVIIKPAPLEIMHVLTLRKVLRGKSYGDYLFGNVLGEGMSGCVSDAYVQIGDAGPDLDATTWALVAVKRYNKPVDSRGTLPADARAERTTSARSPIPQRIVSLVFEYARMDLSSLMAEFQANKRLMPLAFIENLLFELLVGIGQVHALGYINADIKPSNILIGKSGRVKITDSGLSHQSRAADGKFSVTETRRIGTPNYLPPELCVPFESTDGVFDKTIDLWAGGISVLEAMLGFHPLEQPSGIQNKWDRLFRNVANRLTAESQGSKELELFERDRQTFLLLGEEEADSLSWSTDPFKDDFVEGYWLWKMVCLLGHPTGTLSLDAILRAASDPGVEMVRDEEDRSASLLDIVSSMLSWTPEGRGTSACLMQKARELGLAKQ
ncbi:Serine/threonine-protein kinase MRCK alpha [Gonapodya sp. JEL0774]|nr:Serine/threonine-protein kinase MRCK alpha [Gonapodya sp. JEL0774]